MNIERIKPFKESRIVVRVREPEESGEEVTFTSDEEPHFLKPDLGYGFNPLKLGEHLWSPKADCTYEIVRNLGSGANSSVWLVRSST